MTSLLISPDPTARDRSPTPWVLLHVKPRQEKRLAAELVGLGVPCELITVRRERTYGHRRRVVDLPLFPSYLFARVDDDSQAAVERTGRLVEIIPVHDQERLEQDLRQIRRALERGALPEPSPFIRTGSTVRVRRGPLEGIMGVADRRLAPNRIILGIHALGRAVGVDIPDELLEPVVAGASEVGARRAA